MSFFKKFSHFVMGFRNIFYSSHVYNFLTPVSFTFWLSVVSGTKMFIISFSDPLHLHQYRPLLMHQLDLFFSFHICETLMLLGKFQPGESTSFHHMSGLECIRIMATNLSASPGPFRSAHFWFFIPHVAQIRILHNMCDFN